MAKETRRYGVLLGWDLSERSGSSFETNKARIFTSMLWLMASAVK
jgi:hypothetical protein